MSEFAADSCLVQLEVWSKGFRVSVDSEEFQRVVPRERTAQTYQLEKYLDNFSSWGTILESLYLLSEKEIVGQYCLLVRSDHAMVISVGRTEDRHRRPSLVLVACVLGIDWLSPSLSSVISKSHTLTARLAFQYADSFRRNPEHVQAQLRDSRFLKDRQFDVRAEVPVDGAEWVNIVAAIREWNGVTGVATSKLVGLGANVVVGTFHEAELVRSRVELDGYFDVRNKRIHPMSSRIVPWIRPSAVVAEVTSGGSDMPIPEMAKQVGLAEISENIKSLNESVLKTNEVIEENLKNLNDVMSAVVKANESIDASLKRVDHSTAKTSEVVDEGLRNVSYSAARTENLLMEFYNMVRRFWFGDERKPRR